MDSNRAREASAEVCVNGDMPSWWIVIRRIGVIESIRAGIGAAPAQAVRERTPLVEGIGDGVGACGAGEGSQMGPGSCATAPRPVAPLPAQPPRSSNVPPRKSLRVGGVARCVEWLIMAWGGIQAGGIVTTDHIGPSALPTGVYDRNLPRSAINLPGRRALFDRGTH